MKISLFLTFCFFQCTLLAQEFVNIFPHGNIETHTSTWKLAFVKNSKGALFVDSTDFYEGKHSLKLANLNGGNVKAFSNTIIIDQQLPTPIKISYWAKRDSTSLDALTTLDLKIIYNDDTLHYFFHELALSENEVGRWTNKEAVFSPSKPIYSIEPWILNSNSPGNFWVDSIRIECHKESSIPFKSLKSIKITNNHISIDIEAASNFTFFHQINDMKTNTTFLSDFHKSNLWKIILWNKEKDIILDEGRLTDFTILHSQRTKKLILTWHDIPIPNHQGVAKVIVTCELANDSCLSTWRISVSCPKTFQVGKIYFPVIDGIGPIGNTGTDDYYAVPKNSGLLVNNPCENLTVGSLRYGSSASMQFSYYYDNHSGLYLAAYDGHFHSKTFNSYRNMNGTGIHYEIEHDPSGDWRKRNNYSLSYNCIIGTFQGDWFTAAKMYRNWALNQVWCKDGPLIDRSDFPKPLGNIVLWTKGGGQGGQGYNYEGENSIALARKSQKEMISIAGYIDHQHSCESHIRLKDFLGLPIGCWFTDNWHCDGGLGIDANSPRYWPRKGFRETVHLCNKHNITLMPYVNFQRWSIELDSYKQENMITLRDGTPKQVPSHSSFAGIMCPQSPLVKRLWINKLSELAKIGCGAIYLDELSTNGNPVCFNSSFTYSPGDGSARLRANRNLLKDIKSEVRKINPDFFISGEQGSEAYIGLADVCMWWSCTLGLESIPLFEAVYHDYIVSVGTVPGKWYGKHMEAGYADPSGESDLLELTSNIGFCFTAGRQLGWFREDFLDYSPSGAKIIRKLAHIYHQAKEYMLFGEALRPPIITSDIAVLSIPQKFEQFASVDVPAIFSGAWKASDGSVGIVFFNITNTEQVINYMTDLNNDYGLKSMHHKIFKMDGSKEKLVGIADSTIGRTDILLPYEALFMKVIPFHGVLSNKERHLIRLHEELQTRIQESISDISCVFSCNFKVIKIGETGQINGILYNRSHNTFNGNVIISASDGWKVKPSKCVTIRELLPGKYKKIHIILEPGNERCVGLNEISLKVSRCNTVKLWKVRVESARPRTAVIFCTSKPQIDSKISGWNKANFVTLKKPDNYHQYKATATGLFRTLYDSNNLYIQVIVKDNSHYKPDLGGDIWKGDCIQIAFDGTRDKFNYNHSFAVADTNDGDFIWCFDTSQILKQGEVRIHRLGDETVYNVALPWEAIRDKVPSRGDKIGFNLTFNDNDGDGFLGWIEWTPGICGIQAASLFGDLVVE